MLADFSGHKREATSYVISGSDQGQLMDGCDKAVVCGDDLVIRGLVRGVLRESFQEATQR